MQFFTGKNSWPPDRSITSEKRKHDSVESPLDEEGRKKSKAENGVISRDDKIGQDSGDSLHSPSSIDAQQSPITPIPRPSPPIHPNRLQRFTPTSVSHNSTSNKYPHSPLSRSPEHTTDDLAADEPKSSTNYHSNSVWKAESRRSSNGSSPPKPLQIDTARAMSDLDPRSPGYAIRKVASEESRDKTSSPQQGSHHADRPLSNPPSRRQFDSMLPPPSPGFRLPRSESSTPKTSTPVASKEWMNPISAVLNPSGRKSSSLQALKVSADATEITMPKAAAPRIQVPTAHNFMGFAQSIMSTTSVNIKLEKIKGLAIENVKESRRHEKHKVAYASLVDLTNANYGAIQKAKMRLEKQFERHNTSQDLIANALEVHPAQPVAPCKDAVINIGTEIPKDLASMREDLREIRSQLADQRDKGVRQKDLEKFARKTASLDDLEQLITKEELLDIVDKLSARTSDSQSLEAKVSDLASVANERYSKAQETQKRYDKHLEFLDSETSAAIKLEEQRDLAALKEGLGMQTKLAESLEKSVDTWKEDAALLQEEFKQLRSTQKSLEAIVRGDSINNGLGLNMLMENASKELSQLKPLVDQLQEKLGKLEEGAAHDSASPRQRSAPIDDVADPNGHINGIRQDLAEVIGATDELKREFYELADDIDNIRQGLTNLRAEYDRSKDGVHRQHLQNFQPAQLHPEATVLAHTNGLVNLENLSHGKLEKLENDLQALDVFAKSQQLRFDNLTTEDMARSIIHQTKQLYKEHPGHVQDKLRILEEQQRNVDAYITGNLQPRLLQVDMRVSVRARIDALEVLNNRVQVLEENMKAANLRVVQTQKNLSEGIADVRRASTPRDQGPDSARTHETVITLGAELKEVRSKHVELVEMVMTRHGKLQGDVQILNRELYTGAAGNSRKQARLRGSLEYIDLIKIELDDIDGSRHPRSVEPNEGVSFRSLVASMSPSRQESMARARNGLESASDDELDAPMTQLQKRKRKRQSLPKITDEEGDDDSTVHRRAAGKGPR